MTRVNVRMDDDLRNKADVILDELGLTMSSAINIFIKQLVRQGGLPFALTLRTNRSEAFEKKEKLESLLEFAADNKRIESDFKFNRDECYER